MKKLLLLPLLLFVLSCQNDKQIERLKSSLNFKPELTQQFFVASDSVISIKGKKGTKITFKTADLEGLLNGPNIKDSLLINLVELTSKQDLLLANAQTISNGKWLISGGAFNIEIIANGEPLTLKKDKSIKVEFPLSTKENNMQLFYGERDENGDMNWKEENLKLQSEDYYTIFYKDTTINDLKLTKKYGITITRDILLIDTLGYLPLKKIKNKLSTPIQRVDTIRLYSKRINNTIDVLREDEKAHLLLLSEKQADSLLKNHLSSFYALEKGVSDKMAESYFDNILTISKIEELNKKYEKEIVAIKNFNKSRNKLYKSFEVSKLGWVNIDKFAPEEMKVNIQLKYNLNLGTTETYIIDSKNRTVLNVYNDEVNIPTNRGFYILSFGLKEDTFYAFKKSVRFSKSGEYKIEFKKINESQIKSIFKIE